MCLQEHVKWLCYLKSVAEIRSSACWHKVDFTISLPWAYPTLMKHEQYCSRFLFKTNAVSFQYGVDYNSNPFKILYNRLHFQQLLVQIFLLFLVRVSFLEISHRRHPYTLRVLSPNLDWGLPHRWVMAHKVPKGPSRGRSVLRDLFISLFDVS